MEKTPLTQQSLRAWVPGCIWHLTEGGSFQSALYTVPLPQPSANSQDKSYSLIPSPRMTVCVPWLLEGPLTLESLV